MTTIDLRLAKKGRREPTDGLYEQSTVSAGLAHEKATDLARFGWTSAMTDALDADIKTLSLGIAQRLDVTGAARRASDDEQQAIADAKHFLRQMRNALPMVLRKTKVTDVNVEAFHAGKVTRSVATMLVFLSSLQSVVAKLDADFAPYFEGKRASEILMKVLHALQGANVVQELKIDSLPSATLAILEVKGRVLESIEDLNRVGKIAYDGDAGTRARFNKDVLLRARKAQKAASSSDATTSADGADKTATTSPSAPASGADKTATTSPTPDAPSREKTATTSPGATPPAKETKTATLEPAHA
jgi:hypothetical protein